MGIAARTTELSFATAIEILGPLGRHIPDVCARSIVRWQHEDVLESMWAILAANPEKLRMRQWIVEHPFGTIKRSFDQGYMLLRGIDKVRTEFSLTVLAYNMKRAIQIVGVKGLVAELGRG